MKSKISETLGLYCMSHEGRTGESKKLTLVQKDTWESQNIPGTEDRRLQAFSSKE